MPALLALSALMAYNVTSLTKNVSFENDLLHLKKKSALFCHPWEIIASEVGLFVDELLVMKN